MATRVVVLPVRTSRDRESDDMMTAGLAVCVCVCNSKGDSKLKLSLVQTIVYILQSLCKLLSYNFYMTPLLKVMKGSIKHS